MNATANATFPFGQPLLPVRQKDCSPKEVFVLGVYASAVHACWQDAEGQTVVKAFAVASEPCIFWRGDKDEEARIIASICPPKEAGRLVPPASGMNGPSGQTLDDRILKPLGFTRAAAWLCDLVPHSCMNPAQERAIKTRYEPVARRLGLSSATIPKPEACTPDDRRLQAIQTELEQSKAKKLVLLGDLPVRHFLKKFSPQWSRLSDFEPYGSPQQVKIGDQTLEVIALAHPRQVAKLGRSSPRWFEQHENWMNERNGAHG